MKNSFSLLLTNCSPKINYYEGYIFNYQNEPLSGLKVYQQEDSIDISGYTNKKGFF